MVLGCPNSPFYSVRQHLQVVETANNLTATNTPDQTGDELDDLPEDSEQVERKIGRQVDRKIGYQAHNDW